MPYYLSLGYGLKIEDILDSNPKKLEPYTKAHIMEEKRKDKHNWELGLYIRSAIASSMTEKNKYIEKPMYEDFEVERELTEDEKEVQVRMFFSNIESLGREFNESKGKSE